MSMVDYLEERKRIGRNIKKLREDRDLTQEQAADRIGINQRTWSRIEKGANTISTDMLYRISDVFHSQIEYFFREPTPPDAIIPGTKEVIPKQPSEAPANREPLPPKRRARRK